MITNNLFPVKVLYQADTWSFGVDLSDYNASLWTLTYTFRKLGEAVFSISSTPASDGSFCFLIPSATTKAFNPGLYSVSLMIVDAGLNRFTLGSNEIQIKPDPASLTVTDPRTPNRIALDAVEAAIARGAGSDVVEITIAGTTTKKNRQELIDLRTHYIRIVRREMGLPSVGIVRYSF